MALAASRGTSRLTPPSGAGNVGRASKCQVPSDREGAEPAVSASVGRQPLGRSPSEMPELRAAARCRTAMGSVLALEQNMNSCCCCYYYYYYYYYYYDYYYRHEQRLERGSPRPARTALQHTVTRRTPVRLRRNRHTPPKLRRSRVQCGWSSSCATNRVRYRARRFRAAPSRRAGCATESGPVLTLSSI